MILDQKIVPLGNGLQQNQYSQKEQKHIIMLATLQM